MRVALLLSLCVLALADIDPERSFRGRHEPSLRKPLTKGGKATADYLLPTNIVPVTYDVSIIPHLETNPFRRFVFDGLVVIHLHVEVPTSQIVMHAWDLTIGSVEVRKLSDNSIVTVASWDILPDDRQFFTIHLGETLVASSDYWLTISYTGLIHGNDYYGLYYYSYVDAGTTRYMAVTDLESTGARRVVPWFDQPTYKANITLHVAREPGRNVTANMPIASEGDPVPGLENWVWVDFATTPPMSTYLFCFSVHQYASQQSTNDTRITHYLRFDYINTTQYILDISASLLNIYEVYTSIPFSLPKLDQIGLIAFNWGGMENWGLITYRERYLTYDPSLHSTFDKQRRITLVAHEIAHQWFGDLVSPFWWSSIWLNEGFATYYETWGADQLYPDWQMHEQFIVDTMQYALRVDASPSTHPMYADVDTPASIDRIFDGISYEKGGCIVKFMLHFFGDDQFRIAISDYLRQMSYMSADQSDLLSILETYAPPMPNGVTFTQMMESWTNQAGYPLITVTRDYAARTATIKQERYGSSSSEKWIIPLTMTNADMPDFTDYSTKAWLLADGLPVTMQAPEVPTDLQWMMLNIRESGFYRVNYDDTNWDLISAFLSTPGGVSAIAPENRAQLMNDALTLARDGRLSYTIALRTTAYLNHETRVTPWRSVTGTYVMGYIRDRMYQTAEGVQLFQEYMGSKLKTVYADVNGFAYTDLDSHTMLLSRYTATRWSCDMQDIVCNTDGSLLFRGWQQSPNPDTNNTIMIDLRSPVYCAGQRVGGQTDFDFLVDRYLNATVYSDESLRLINAMGCASDTALLQRLLNMSLSPPNGASGDSLNALRSVSYNPLGVDMALDFIIANWIQLDPLYGNIGNGFTALSSKLNTQEHYNKILQFRSDYISVLSAGALAGIQSTLSTLDETLAWNFANLATVMDYFRNA